MAEQIKLKPHQIKPSQNFLKKNTLAYIKKCVDEEREEDLPPTPLVTKIGEAYVAIDGHNLISVFDELKRDIEVYVVESAEDVPKELKDTPRERALATKFPYIQKMYQAVTKEGITNFTLLRNKGNLKDE